MRKRVEVPRRPYISQQKIKERVATEIKPELKAEVTEEVRTEILEQVNDLISDIVENVESYSRYDLTDQVGNSSINLDPTPNPNTFICTLNGQVMLDGGDFNFTSPSTIEFTYDLDSESTLLVFYKKNSD